MLKKYFTIPKEIEPSSLNYGRYKFLYSFIVICGAVLIYFLFFNLTVTKYYLLAFMEIFTLLNFPIILFYLQKNRDIDKASLYFIGLVAFLVFFVNILAIHEKYNLIWNIFLPLISFYLLGTKKASLLITIYTVILFSYMLSITPELLDPSSTKNFIIAFILFSIGVYSYEKSRSDTYTKLKAVLELEHQHSIEYQKLSTIDPLTQIYNRLKLDEYLTSIHTRALRYSENFSIIIIDIDHFKEVNDNYGHLVGDEILIEFTKLISAHIRTSDIFGRWGGEEFMLILPNSTCKTAIKTATNLLQHIQNHDFHHIFSNTASFGIASYSDEKNILDLVNSADKALYQSKEYGRNCITAKEPTLPI